MTVCVVETVQLDLFGPPKHLCSQTVAVDRVRREQRDVRDGAGAAAKRYVKHNRKLKIGKL